MTDLSNPEQALKNFVHSRTPENLLKLLNKNRHIIIDNITFLKEAYSVLNTFMGLLHEGICATETDITISRMPERRIILGGINDFVDSISFFSEFIRFCSGPHNPSLNLSYPIGGYFDSMEVFLNEPSQPTRFFSLDHDGHE